MGSASFTSQTSNDNRERGQGFPSAICFALLEIITALSHGVGDMSEAKNSHSGRVSKCVKGSRFHFDRKDTFGARSVDCVCCLTKGRVCGPTRPHHAVEAALFKRHCSLLHKDGVCLCELGWRRIVVARPFITQ